VRETIEPYINSEEANYYMNGLREGCKDLYSRPTGYIINLALSDHCCMLSEPHLLSSHLYFHPPTYIFVLALRKRINLEIVV
jgi:hypothetical protein